MSTIKVDTIATRTGSGNITASNAILAPSIGGSSDTNTSLSFPGSDVVQLNNGGAARHKFHALNGTSLFEVQASSTGGSGAGGAFLKFKGSNGTPVDIASIDGSMTNGSIGSESGILSFFTMNSGTNSEKVRIFSNGSMAVPNGISIGNGISAAASYLLDDYEEGTWTPTFVSTGASFAYSVQGGNYTKVGRLVFANFRIQLSGAPSGSTGSVVFVGGLPFVIGTQVGTYHGGHPGHYFGFNLSQTGTLAYQLPQGDQKVELKVVGDNLGETAVLASHLNSNAQIRGQILYHTA